MRLTGSSNIMTFQGVEVWVVDLVFFSVDEACILRGVWGVFFDFRRLELCEWSMLLNL